MGGVCIVLSTVVSFLALIYGDTGVWLSMLFALSLYTNLYIPYRQVEK
jgi:hypothetical protein